MALFLPHNGWHILFAPGVDPLDEPETNPLGADYQRYEWGLTEEPHELVLMREYDPGPLKGDRRVRSVREVWFYTTLDRVTLPEAPKGRTVSNCGGTAVLYDSRDEALADLATVYEPVRLLLGLGEFGSAKVRPLARAVLDGDVAALPVLADALEEDGHPQAPAVRQLSDEGSPKKAAKKAASGKRRPSKAAPAPAPASVTSPGTAKKPTGQEVVLVGGMPAGGKTTFTRTLTEQGYQRLNRDAAGGKVDDLLPALDTLLSSGASVVMDNLYATRASRAGAVRLAKQKGVPIRFVLMDTSLEDAQLNACLRMMERCGRVMHPEDHKKAPYKDDPGLFPVAVLYKYRNEFEEPQVKEGFDAVERVKFARQRPADWTNKAVIFDFDGTLRTHQGKQKYPVSPAEVRALVGRAAKVRACEAQGYLLLGASNQSGVAKGHLTAADAEACFAETLRQLGLTFREVRYCPHKVPPISCYCRKPGPGMGVELIVKYKLDPGQCIYVGDAGTDRSFAARCGFQFADEGEFFRA
jgi:HAD superfamily hydrolase (TIGR01662 family)